MIFGHSKESNRHKRIVKQQWWDEIPGSHSFVSENTLCDSGISNVYLYKYYSPESLFFPER